MSDPGQWWDGDPGQFDSKLHSFLLEHLGRYSRPMKGMKGVGTSQLGPSIMGDGEAKCMSAGS